MFFSWALKSAGKRIHSLVDDSCVYHSRCCFGHINTICSSSAALTNAAILLGIPVPKDSKVHIVFRCLFQIPMLPMFPIFALTRLKGTLQLLEGSAEFGIYSHYTGSYHFFVLQLPFTILTYRCGPVTDSHFKISMHISAAPEYTWNILELFNPSIEVIMFEVNKDTRRYCRIIVYNLQT